MKKLIQIRNYKYRSLVTILLLSTVACNKEWLKPKPLSFNTPENTYTTPEALRSCIVACRRALVYEFLGDKVPLPYQLYFSDVAVDGTTAKSLPDINIAALITPEVGIVNRTGSGMKWYWTESYKDIKYANTVLAYINVPKWDTTKPEQLAERNALIGSAYFFRAYRYYDLCNTFGNVPYAGKLYTAPKLDFQTVDRKVILKQMKKELEFAVKWVPDNVPKGEVTKGACLHLLAKIDLALGNFDDAVKAASEVINGGAYHLMTQRFGIDKDNPARNVIWDLHRPANKLLPENKEGLFYIIDLPGFESVKANRPGGSAMMRNYAPQWGSNIVTPAGNKGTLSTDPNGNPSSQQILTGRSIGRVRGTWYSTHEIWANDPGDYRHSEGNWWSMDDYVYNNYDLEGKDTSYLKPLRLYSSSGQILCSDTIRSWYGWPYYKLYIPDHINSFENGGHTPWYIFRLAETYLIRAEAYYWKGDMLNAAADINIVRARANAQPIGAGDVNIGTILDERNRELYGEEKRHEELVRIAYIFVQTGKPDYKGRTYSMSNFSKNNFWYDRIMDKTDFYNKGVHTKHGDEYAISPHNVLWPIPQSAIDANVNGHINQNKGYTGSDSNVPPLEQLPKG